MEDQSNELLAEIHKRLKQASTTTTTRASRTTTFLPSNLSFDNPSTITRLDLTEYNVQLKSDSPLFHELIRVLKINDEHNENDNNNDNTTTKTEHGYEYDNEYNQQITHVCVCLLAFEDLTWKEQKQIMVAIGKLPQIIELRLESRYLADEALQLFNLTLRTMIQQQKRIHQRRRRQRKGQRRQRQQSKMKYQNNNKNKRQQKQKKRDEYDYDNNVIHKTNTTKYDNNKQKKGNKQNINKKGSSNNDDGDNNNNVTEYDFSDDCPLKSLIFDTSRYTRKFEHHRDRSPTREGFHPTIATVDSDDEDFIELQENVSQLLEQTNLESIQMECVDKDFGIDSFISTIVEKIASSNNDRKSSSVSTSTVTSTSLKHLSITSNRWSWEDRLSEETVFGIFELPDLESLTLTGQGLRPRHFDSIILEGTSNLRSLRLDYNFLGNDTLQELPMMLDMNSTLYELSLEQNGLKDIDVSNIFQALKSNRKNCLQVLDLSHNDLGPDACQVIANVLASSTSTPSSSSSSRSTTATETTMATAAFTTTPGKASVATIKSYNDDTVDNSNIYDNDDFDNDKANTNANNRNNKGKNYWHCLQHLNLSQNQLLDEGCTILASSLITNTSLISLDLSDTQLTDSLVCSRLATALGANTTLQELNLELNQIKDEGCTALIQGLTNNKNVTLKSLNISFNHIGDTGAIVLADALSQNTSLERLYLGGNNQMEECASKAVATMIEMNETLQILALPDTLDQKTSQISDTYIRLNRLGRKKLLQRTDDVRLWSNALLQCQDDLHCTYFLIRSNPNLLSWMI